MPRRPTTEYPFLRNSYCRFFSAYWWIRLLCLLMIQFTLHTIYNAILSSVLTHPLFVRYWSNRTPYLRTGPTCSRQLTVVANQRLDRLLIAKYLHQHDAYIEVAKSIILLAIETTVDSLILTWSNVTLSSCLTLATTTYVIPGAQRNIYHFMLLSSWPFQHVSHRVHVLVV